MILTTVIYQPGPRRGGKHAFTIKQIDSRGRHEVGVIASNGIQAVRIAREVFEGRSRAAMCSGKEAA